MEFFKVLQEEKERKRRCTQTDFPKKFIDTQLMVQFFASLATSLIHIYSHSECLLRCGVESKASFMTVFLWILPFTREHDERGWFLAAKFQYTLKCVRVHSHETETISSYRKTCIFASTFFLLSVGEGGEEEEEHHFRSEEQQEAPKMKSFHHRRRRRRPPKSKVVCVPRSKGNKKGKKSLPSYACWRRHNNADLCKFSHSRLAEIFPKKIPPRRRQEEFNAHINVSLSQQFSSTHWAAMKWNVWGARL